MEEAHRHGRKVAAHVHGSEGVALALEAGVDTIEHGTALTAAQAEEMAERGVALVPTLAAVQAFEGHEDELPESVRRRMDEVRELQGASIRRAVEAGVRVLTGTDAGTPFNPPGRLPTEVRLLAQLGLGTAGALRAATDLAADVLGLEDLGVLAPGRRADLCLFPGDPLDDPGILEHPRLVVQDGLIRRE